MGRGSIKPADIVDAVKALMLRRGVQITTREIAQEVGASEATLFKHFPTKEAMVQAALTLDGAPYSVDRLTEPGDAGTEFELLMDELEQNLRLVLPVLRFQFALDPGASPPAGFDTLVRAVSARLGFIVEDKRHTGGKPALAEIVIAVACMEVFRPGAPRRLRGALRTLLGIPEPGPASG